MNEHDHKPPETPKYEGRDVNISAILRVGVVLLILIVVAQAAVAWIMDTLASEVQQAQPKISPLVKRDRVRLPEDLAKIPPPRLQIAETLDLAHLRALEAGKLRHIDKAIELLADPKSAARYGVVSAKGGG